MNMYGKQNGFTVSLEKRVDIMDLFTIKILILIINQLNAQILVL